MRDALAQVREAVARWMEFAGEAGLLETEAKAVAKDHRPV